MAPCLLLNVVPAWVCAWWGVAPPVFDHHREGYIIAEIAPKPLSPKDVVELAGRQMDCKMWVFGVGWNSTIVSNVAGKLRFALGIVNAEGKVRGCALLSQLRVCVCLSSGWRSLLVCV